MGQDITSRVTVAPSTPGPGLATLYPFGATDAATVYRYKDAVGVEHELTATLGGILGPAQGGTGVANNAASTITIVGAFGITLTLAGAAGISLASGKTLTVSNTLALAGTDGSTLNVGTGGTLGTAAYTSAGAYLPISGGTLTGNLLFTDATYDIGATGATRPRDLFLSRNAVVGGTLGATGAINTDSTTESTSVTTGSIQTDGGIGVVKAAWIGGNVTVGGATDSIVSIMPLSGSKSTLKFGPSGFTGYYRIEHDNTTGDLQTYMNNTSRETISVTGTYKWSAYGAGAATFDASGNITSVSDESVKRNIRPFTTGLAAIVALAQAPNGVILHGYAPESGLDQTRNDYAGFSANVVQTIIPEAVGKMADELEQSDNEASRAVVKVGALTLNPFVIVAALVNAMAELAARVETLEAAAK